MRIHKLFQTFGSVGVFLIAAAFARNADASVIVDITQAGPNVDVTGSGSLNLAALSLFGTQTENGEVHPTLGTVLVGPNSSIDEYEFVLGGPANIGPGGRQGAFSGSGATFGYDANSNDLLVPHGYTSGTPLSGSNVYDNATISSLGLTPGTYTWNWGTGPTADSFVVNVAASAASVPEPGSFILVPVGTVILLFVLLQSNRRRRQTGDPRNAV